MSIPIKIVDTPVIDQFMGGCFEGVAVGSGNGPAGNKGDHQNCQHWLSLQFPASHKIQVQYHKQDYTEVYDISMGQVTNLIALSSINSSL